MAEMLIDVETTQNRQDDALVNQHSIRELRLPLQTSRPGPMRGLRRLNPAYASSCDFITTVPVLRPLSIIEATIRPRQSTVTMLTVLAVHGLCDS